MRRRTLLRRWLGLLLALCLLPGWDAVLEMAEHLLHDGHSPHGQVHEALASGGDHDGRDCGQESGEHGCTSMSHQCDCCSSMPGATSLALLPLQGRADVERRPPHRAEGAMPTRSDAPPTRPPIA